MIANSTSSLGPPMSAPELTGRTLLIGRGEELARLGSYLHARGERHFVYYWADGGLGKTRLLEELERMVRRAGPGYRFSGIIDLYHTETHSNSDVEHTIVDGLDPGRRYFPEYRIAREEYVRARERGTNPDELEQRRRHLSQVFIEGFNRLAQEAYKLVLCFDTIELLQYESWVVEERAKLDEIDARLKAWLLKTLPQLRNVLVVFAGRPRQSPAEEAQAEFHRRLLNDMQKAFEITDSHWLAVELQPFTLPETEEFIRSLSAGQEIIPPTTIPLVHRLTEGRPIFLHLVIDLLHRLSREPTRILSLFERSADLAAADESDARLRQARQQVQRDILSNLYNNAGEVGLYIGRLALMPKGVDADILHEALGLPQDEAGRLLGTLQPLSFIKQHRGRATVQAERIFLHDEMYRLLTAPELVQGIRVEERAMAGRLASGYYARHISELETHLRVEQDPNKRVPLRRRLQQLQVEQLYYVLAHDVTEGYRQYHKLSNQANRARQIGFSMQLLDEFLRFYRIPSRQRLFAVAGISNEQVIRDSALLWLERFHWWGHYERAVQFAEQVCADPAVFSITEEDLAARGNLLAFWVRDRTLRYGYEPATIEAGRDVLEQLRARPKPTPAEQLARARLATSIGYMLDTGGLLDSARRHYVEANAAFKQIREYRDELAMLLNNLAYLYASQGEMTLARSLASEALAINQALGADYSTGLTLTTLANVEIRRGDYLQAREYGDKALTLFRSLEDAHGTVLALLSIAQAHRKLAKYKLIPEREFEEAQRGLAIAADFLTRALKTAHDAGLKGELARLHAKLGKVYRDTGVIWQQLGQSQKAKDSHDSAAREFEEALQASELSRLERADALADFAEGLFVAGKLDAAVQGLQRFKQELGRYYVPPLDPADDGRPTDQPEEELPSEYYRPLAKAERLRGQMAMQRGHDEEALRHYVTAYDYFIRFSPTASELDAMVELMYSQLNSLPFERQQSLMAGLNVWIEQLPPSYRKLRKFMRNLQTLLGV